MGKNSGIEWTHHTFNPWWGCVKVSPACTHCYAESWAKRVGSQVWGIKSPRRFFSENHWKQPISWNREAEVRGERRRVFCASMADVFEDRRDLDAWRDRLWDLVAKTPWLDWLLLTKRPEHASGMTPWHGQWPDNVWVGTTVESQEWADKRVPVLARIPAVVRFLSCEPMLGPISLCRWLPNGGEVKGSSEQAIHWVIAGGESGRGARPMHPAWVRDLRDQCVMAGVAFHFKQWGNWRPLDAANQIASQRIELEHSGTRTIFVNMGKKKAGRDLDGMFWDELPQNS